ncbi:MAG: hypothetical protein OXE53_17585 [Deltaproteobacteria bacterium]|nr:hypothetical protein [Deltaproteobacteria bacterium]
MIEFEAVKIGELLGPVAALMVGAAQCSLIWIGLRRMDRASRERDRQIENQNRDSERRHEEAQRRHEEAEKESARRHEEAMTSLRALIERTSVPRPPSAHA